MFRVLILLLNGYYNFNFLLQMYYKKRRIDEQKERQEIAQEKKETLYKNSGNNKYDNDATKSDTDEAFLFNETFCVYITCSIGILLDAVNLASIFHPEFRGGTSNSFAFAAYVIARG